MRFLIFPLAALIATIAIWAAPATGQEQLPEQSAFLTVCNTATQLGQIQGVSVSHCRKVAVVEEGNLALVTVSVKVAGQGKFLIHVALQKSVWTQSALDVQPG